MNLYFRVLFVLIASLFRPKIADVLAPCSLRLRVLPNDLDFHGHMNNGRYLTVMDLGRFDLILRSGLFAISLKQKSVPILASAKIRYRFPLKPFEPFDLVTRIVCWDGKWVYMEQRFVAVRGEKAGDVAAVALLKASYYDRRHKRTVPTPELLHSLGIDRQSPPAPEHMRLWIEAEDALRGAMKEG